MGALCQFLDVAYNPVAIFAGGNTEIGQDLGLGAGSFLTPDLDKVDRFLAQFLRDHALTQASPRLF